MATTFKILGWSFIVVAIALYFASVNYTQLIDYPLCGGVKDIAITAVPSQTQVPLRPDCWSGNIEMPDTPPFTFRIRNPGVLEYKFWDGRRLLFGATDEEWIGEIGNANFRLRGDGTATITVEPQ